MFFLQAFAVEFDQLVAGEDICQSKKSNTSVSKSKITKITRGLDENLKQMTVFQKPCNIKFTYFQQRGDALLKDLIFTRILPIPIKLVTVS